MIWASAAPQDDPGLRTNVLLTAPRQHARDRPQQHLHVAPQRPVGDVQVVERDRRAHDVEARKGFSSRSPTRPLSTPDETVRRALYPVVGKGTLRDLVREAKANEAAFRARVRTVLRSS